MDVLIVDDSRAMRNFLRKSLAMTGLAIGQVHEAANGEEALALLEHVGVQVIFSDINMPVMDGVVFVTELARRDMMRTTPVIVVSSDSSTERSQQILALGASSYLTKPFSPEMLESEVSRLLPAETILEGEGGWR
jgi:two-component system chemotaxis response regulator CheY